MERVEVEHPVEGWNPVPGDPDSLVWWDGARFTHEAIRSGDGWSIVGEGPGGSGPAERPLVGWSPAPGDPQMHLWWNGARPTHRAVPAEDGGWLITTLTPRERRRAARESGVRHPWSGRSWAWWPPRVVLGSGLVLVLLGVLTYLSGIMSAIAALGNQDWDDRTGDEMIATSGVLLRVGLIVAVIGLAWWVAATWVPRKRVQHPEGSPRRSGCVSAVLVAGVLGVLAMGVSFSRCASNYAGPPTATLDREIDGWRLPKTIRPVATPRSLSECEERVCRYFEARGVDAKTAARDLVRSLNRQGYSLSLLFEDDDAFWSDLAKSDERCELDVDGSVEDRQGRELVEVSIGSC